MTDLSTLAGQQEHYKAVHERLMSGKDMRPPKPAPLPPPAPVYRYNDHTFIDLLRPPSWMVIVELVARKHGVLVSEILSPSRVRHLTIARQEAMFLVATHIDEISLPRVGRKFNRDHTTALHAIRKVAEKRGEEWAEDAWRSVGSAGSAVIERLRARMNRRSIDD